MANICEYSVKTEVIYVKIGFTTLNTAKFRLGILPLCCCRTKKRVKSQSMICSTMEFEFDVRRRVKIARIVEQILKLNIEGAAEPFHFVPSLSETK